MNSYTRRTIVRLCYAFIFAAGIFSGAGKAYASFFATEGTPVCVKDSFFPEIGNCGYDATHYDVAFSWIEESSALQAVVKISLTINQDAPEIYFDFTDTFQIDQVLLNHEPVDYQLEPEDLIIFADFQKGQNYEIQVSYQGEPIGYNVLSSDLIITDEISPFCLINEPIGAHFWFPCNDHPTDRATFSSTITVPAKFAVASNGRLLKIVQPDGQEFIPEGDFVFQTSDSAKGTATYYYEANEAIPPYLYTVCAGKFLTEQKVGDDGIVQLDFTDQSAENMEEARRIADMLPDMMACLEKVAGKYPFSDSGSILINRSFGGALETQTRSIYSPETVIPLVYAHELAHQWIGNQVAIQDWSDMWIKEGWASYAEALWSKCDLGEDAFRKDLFQFYSNVANADLYVYSIEAYRELYLDVYNLTDVWFASVEEVQSGLELLFSTKLNEDQLAGLREKMSAGKINGVAFWDMAGEYGTQVVITPEKINLLRKFFGITGKPDAKANQSKNPRDISPDVNEMYGVMPYSGGALVYAALNIELGDELFSQAIQAMIKKYQWSTINTEQFIESFSETAGRDLAPIFRQWLDYETVPDLPGYFSYADVYLLPVD